MSDSEINLAIAEACGKGKEALPPNYCTDLNAMNDAPHNLSLFQYSEYGNCLERVVARDNSFNATSYGIFDATARQRAEAFLRTIWEWKE